MAATHELICAEITPALPNLSAADRRLLRSHETRCRAVATVVSAARELLTGETDALALSPGPTMLTPAEPRTRDRSKRYARPRKRVYAGAALVVVAAVAALRYGAMAKTAPRHVSTISADAALPDNPGTTQLSAPAPAAPQAVDAPAATAPPDTVTTDPGGSGVPDNPAPIVLAAAPPSEPVCPSGTVTASVRQVEAQQSSSDPTAWNVTIVGTVSNGTATPIVAPSIRVTITTSNGDEPDSGDPANAELGAGQSSTWTATSYVSSTTKPTATAQPARWAWEDPRYAECPTG